MHVNKILFTTKFKIMHPNLFIKFNYNYLPYRGYLTLVSTLFLGFSFKAFQYQSKTIFHFDFGATSS